MSESSLGKDPMRITLKKLIEDSNAKFSADDVLREFRGVKEKRSDRKLLKILEIISKNQPKANEHLTEASKLLAKKDPFYCLLSFLNHYMEGNSIMQTLGKKDISTSTPFNAKKKFEVTSGHVSEIKERVVQAASGNSSSRPIITMPLTINSSTNGIISNQNEFTVRRVVIAAGPGGSISVGAASSASSSHKKFATTKGSSNSTSGTAAAAFPTCKRTDALWDFYQIDGTMQFTQNEIAAMPISSQENVLLFDLIYCLGGMRGTYITPVDAATNNENEYRTQFKISEQVHESLRDIASEIVPLASYYNCIQKFIHQAHDPGAGQVLQALSSALEDLLHDYYLLLAQLENELMNEALTLHKMHFYLRPTLITNEIIAATVVEIMTNNLHGAAVLSLLYEKINSLAGDDESQKFIIQITQLASVPYMSILQLWIQKGVINDPQNEFLVEDNDVIQREDLSDGYSADYWEKRYTIRPQRIPCFLAKVSDIILRTGKYLNAVRQCGKKVELSQMLKLDFEATSQTYIQVIQNAYHFASKNLLEVLLKENDLMGHLMSVKRYLLLNQGDFIMQFMDACEEELSKNVDQVLPMALENLLGLTLRISSARNDPYKDDLHCELLTYDLVTQMSKIMNNEEEYWQPHDRLDLNGLECFAFRYDVQWPIWLVLNHIAISKYQMLFRQLFYCKHVERQLCKIWKENSIAKKFSPEAAELYRSAFTLRQRMMNAVQNLEYYMMVEVIEPNWHTFIQKIDKVENIDEVLTLHQDFLDSCLKNCMLTDNSLLNRSIFKMCNICLKFCDFIQSESSMAPTETFSERVKRFDLEFTGILISFLNQINDTAMKNPSDRFLNLVHRINFNYFYNEQMEKLCAKDSMNPSHH